MPRYYKRINKNASSEEYTVIGKAQGTGSVPLGVVTARIKKEGNYPNFDFSNTPADVDSYSKLAKNLRVSEDYLYDQIAYSDNHDSDLHYAVMDTVHGAPSSKTRGTSGARKAGIRYAKGVKTLKTSKEFQPTELFTTTPPSVEITGATVDPSLKSSFLTIGALIHKQHGTPITASDDLSRWSSGVSRNAQKRGLPIVGGPTNPSMSQTNEIAQQSRSPFNIARENVEELVKGDLIPDSEVQGARQHLRTLLGYSPKPAKQHLSHQFNDIPFPGMETF